MRNKRQNGFNTARKIECVKASSNSIGRLSRAFTNRSIRFPGWDLALEILLYHRQSAACQIADAICEIRVVAVDQSIVTEVTVLTEGNFAPQKIAQCIGSSKLVPIADDLRDRGRSHDVATRLAHLAFLHQNPAVSENLLR